MDDYTLGIIWSIGSYQENRFVFKHRDRYYLEQIQKRFGNTIYEQIGTTGKSQFVLKTAQLKPEDLYGWSERNAQKRDIPGLTRYNDFLRAYFEIHSALGYHTAYGRKKQKKYKRLRLRVYGNYFLIKSMNDILSDSKADRKSIQRVNSNNTTAYLQYTSLNEIIAILNWITGNPCNKEFWDDIDRKISEPIKYK